MPPQPISRPDGSLLAVRRAAITNDWRLAILASFTVATFVLRRVGFPAPQAMFFLFCGWTLLVLAFGIAFRQLHTSFAANTLHTVVWCLDVTFLSAVYTQIGGGWWLGPTNHAFVVVFAYASLPRKRAGIVAGYAIVAYVALNILLVNGWVSTEQPFFGIEPLAGRAGLAVTVTALGTIALIAFAIVQDGFIRIMRSSEMRARAHEERLRQAQKMEALGRLAGGIAHDFNNLLTVVTAHTQFLARGIEPGTSRRKDVDAIHDAAMLAGTLTNQLLAFSRKQVVQERMLDLNERVRSMDRMLHRLLDDRISVRTTFHQRELPIVADPGQLDQLVLNLALNARDAMRNGGTLTIETDVAFLDPESAQESGHPTGEYALLLMRDTGHGMSEATKQQVFEPFFTTKPEGEGTGLGLATVAGIVERCGGWIDLDSEEGKGTTFRLYLPLGELPAVRTSSVALMPPRGGTETVLVVEDNQQLRDVTCAILEHHGYAIFSARDGKDALRKLQERGGVVDLIVSDLMMPELTGQQMIEQVWVKRPEMRVLFVSGFAEADAIARGLTHPGVAFLGKPFTPDSLARRVRDVLDGVAPPAMK
ncbi:MAG: sensor protein [Gemmatimonadetes bacterium]|nr:sensor protein [Gemmatimonadota bacterium]